MSLYEKYHSEINSQHIYGIVSDIVNKEFGIVLDDITESKDDFQKQLIKTFSENESDDLVTLNKSLIDKYMSNARENYKKTDIDNKYSDLLRDRDTLFTNNIVSEEIVPEEEEIISEEEIEEVMEEEETNESIHINSSKRSTTLSSRFYYSYDLKKNKIDSRDIEQLSRMILQIEDTYLFSHPVLFVSIKELDYKIYLQKVQTIENGDRKYGVYESFDKSKIQPKDISKLTIDIRDVSGTRYKHHDIVKVNILEIKGDIIRFTCSQLQSTDFRKGDSIKLININSRKYKELFTYPLQISKLSDSKIYCRLDEEYDEVIDDTVDMKIMNISNQNILYFN